MWKATMNCLYCGFLNDRPTPLCVRCGASIAAVPCETSCGRPASWGKARCQACAQRRENPGQCPSCAAPNAPEAMYCLGCGAPMAIITRVVARTDLAEVAPASDTWRIYGIETMLVGRAPELEWLERWHADVLESGQSRVLAITSGEGLGKSRLLAEFARQLAERFAPSLWIKGTCRDEPGNPLGTLARALRGRFYIFEQDTPTLASRKFEDAVKAIMGPEAPWLPVAQRAATLLGMGASSGSGIWPSPDSSQLTVREEKCFEALEELLRADARQNPLVIVLEDVQYASPQMLRLLEHLTRFLVESPILFITCWNPAEVGDLALLLEEIPFNETIELQPLSDDEVAHFLRSTLGPVSEVPEELVDRIVESAHGNPLVIEQTLRILMAQAVIDTRKSPWHVDVPKLVGVGLPCTVEASVQARLNELTDEEALVLGMASAAGLHISAPLARCLYHLHKNREADGSSAAIPEFWSQQADNERVDAILESLERKDILRRQPAHEPGQADELRFKHRLENKTIYERLPQPTRQRYHRLIAQWLDRNLGEMRPAHLESIARHFDQGRCLDQAARLYVEAASEARHNHANAQALQLFERGLALLGESDLALKHTVLHDLGSVHETLGEYEQAVEYYREMLRYAWILQDEVRGAVACNKMGRALRSLGRYDDALVYLHRALDLFRNARDERGIAATLDDLGQVHWVRGQSGEAQNYLLAGLRLRRDLGQTSSIAVSLSNLGALHLQRGAFKEAMSCFREALELRKAADDKHGMADSFNQMGVLCMEWAEVEQSMTLFNEALGMAQSTGHRGLEASILANLGQAHLAQSRHGEARRCLEQARALAEESGDRRLLCEILRQLGLAVMREQGRAEALGMGEEALALGEALKSQTLVALSRLSLAQVHSHFVLDPQWRDASAGEARRLFALAIAHFEAVEASHLRARALMGMGRMLVELAQESEARPKLQQARQLFEQHAMPRSVQQVDQLLRALAPPAAPGPRN